MILLLILLFGISIYGIKLSSFHEDYICLEATNSIKGIFAVIVLLSHIRNYITLDSSFENHSYIIILNYVGQLMVALYLFYSGYGIMESFKKKKNYGETFLKNRILKTLIHFDIAVVFYILFQFCIGNKYDYSFYFKSLIGWESVGNSNWFIFDIIMLYFIVFLSYRLFKNISNKHQVFTRENQKKHHISFLIIVFAQCICLCFLLLLTKKGSWWINTIMTFPLGIFYSIYRTQVEKLLRNKKLYFIFLLSLSFFFINWRYLIGIDRLGICSCLFCLLVVIISMKIKFDNKVLQWLGTQAFAIYIIQRLPMLYYTWLGINTNILLFVTLTILSVMALAFIYTNILKIIDIILFKQSKL